MRRLTSATASVVLLAACTGGGPRPVPHLARPDSDTLDRLRVDENERETAPVALIALPVGDSADEAPDAPPASDPLSFEELLRSVEEQFPLVLAALEEVEVAAGELLSAQGGFDARLRATGNLGLDGFYENETARVVIEQPTAMWGATVFGGYSIGTGDFAIWDGGLKTKTDGQFSAGVRLPLLAGRSIDSRRLALWQARITQAQAQPFVLKSRLDATRKAAGAYWKWAAAGQKLEIARRLLALAEDRQEGLALSVAEGELPKIALLENRRLVVERESIVVRSERGLQEAAIRLSLFWRGPDGAPRVPEDTQLPRELPTPRDPALFTHEEDIQLALQRRPEVRQFVLEVEQLELDMRKARNDALPQLDVAVAGSQDIGDVVSDPDDKGPFELDAFVRFDVPLQRRSALGRVRSLGAKQVKLERGLQLARDRVVADVQDADSALQQTWLRLAQVRENVQLAGQLEEAERIALREGESDLLRVNLREQQTASAAATLVDVVAEHFRSLAEYRASLGVPYDEVLRGRQP